MADAPPRQPVAPPPVQPTEPVEWRLALRGVAMTLALGTAFVAGAAVLAGQRGALGAGIAVAVVAGMLLLSGGAMSLMAPFGPSALMAAVLGGYVLKLCIYALLILLLRDVAAIDGPSLAITAAVLMLAALAWQARVALRDKRLFWVSADRSDTADTAADVVYPSGRVTPTRSSDSRSTERTPA